ncbi:RHS repeat-associated core domain protein [compost metagenome]
MHYVFEPGGFVPLLQASCKTDMRKAMLARPARAAMAYMGDSGEYDIDRDPLHNGDYQPGGESGPPPWADIHFYQCDHLGTPMELTDEEGNIAWEANYKAWGQAQLLLSKAAQKAGLKNPIRFQGQYLDDETGLHYNRHRYYDPVTGRFVSKDPIGLAGGLNLAQYASNPVGWIDPFGLAAGKATVHWHDNRSADNAYGHYSVSVQSEGKEIHTHQMGAPGTSTKVSSNLSGVVAPSKSKVIDLPDATAAQSFQRENMGKDGGAYDIRTRSCVTHVGEVLRAGGADVPVEAGAQFKYLKRKGL